VSGEVSAEPDPEGAMLDVSQQSLITRLNRVEGRFAASAAWCRNPHLPDILQQLAAAEPRSTAQSRGAQAPREVYLMDCRGGT
jgi:hypothetical protein